MFSVRSTRARNPSGDGDKGIMSVSTYKAPWSRTLVLMSGFTALLLMGVAIVVYLNANQVFISWILFLVVGSGALFTIRGYSLTRDDVLVRRLFWSTRLSLRELASARFEPDVMTGSIRLFGNGGLFSFTGLFRNRVLGSYRAFVTDPHRTVVLRFPRRVVVLSPGEPDAFVEQIRRLRGMSTSGVDDD
jgi:hypothetical protein